MSKKYEEMSDFEINCEVLRRIFAGEEGLRFTKHYRGFKEGHPLSGSVVCRFLDGSISTADFCRKPDDAWPIIVENEISTWAISEADREIGMSYSTGEWKAYCVKAIDGESCVSDDGFEASDQNPLRAAMICFLKMKDNEQ